MRKTLCVAAAGRDKARPDAHFFAVRGMGKPLAQALLKIAELFSQSGGQLIAERLIVLLD
jgi:hypothetical protein